MHKFTVIWGNIGDDSDRRLDHVTVTEPTFDAVITEARAIVQRERVEGGTYADDADAAAGAEQLEHDCYDGFAIFDGHLVESATVRFS